MLAVILALCVTSHVSAGETITFYHNDVAGSPMLATDVNGLQVWKETYRPYGDQLIDSAASQNNDVWFAGKPYDESTGLSYMGARYYDPTLGRFMGVDPIGVDLGNLHSFNRYAYANNNPYRFLDPNGEAAISILAVPILLGAGCAISDSCRNALAPLISPLINGTLDIATARDRMLSEASEPKIATDNSGGTAADGGTPETVDDVIKDLEKKGRVDDRGRSPTKGIRNVDLVGTGVKVQDAWGRIVGAAGGATKPTDTPWGPGEAVDLPGGGSANVRPGSKSGPPTIEINRPDSKPWKSRHDH